MEYALASGIKVRVRQFSRDDEDEDQHRWVVFVEQVNAEGKRSRGGIVAGWHRTRETARLHARQIRQGFYGR